MKLSEIIAITNVGKIVWVSFKWMMMAVIAVAGATLAFDQYLIKRASAVFEPRIHALEQRHNDAMERLKSMDNKLDILIKKVD